MISSSPAHGHNCCERRFNLSWLASCKERGLELSHEKTYISRVEEGFDFLGQHVRRFGTKVLLKPSAKSVRALLDKIDKLLQSEGGHLPVGLLIAQLNLLLRGGANYHRYASSTRTFARVDNLIFRKLWRWTRRRHPTKGARWVKAKYFTQRGADRWVFHGRCLRLRRLAWPLAGRWLLLRPGRFAEPRALRCGRKATICR